MSPGSPQPLTPSPSLTPLSSAVIFHARETGGLRLVTLPLLDRLVIAIHRAGFKTITIVTGDPVPDLPRSRAWGVTWEVTKTAPTLEGPVLAATTALVVQSADVQRLQSQPGQLIGSDGRPMPIGIVTSWNAENRPDFSGLPQVQARGASIAIRDAQGLKPAARILWASLTSASDGTVDRFFNRPVGRFLSKVLVRTTVTPNLVSLGSIVLGLAAAWLLALGEWGSSIVGALIFQLSAIVDCVDGDLARVKFQESALGKWLDLAGDQVVHAGVFAGIAIGLSRTSGSPIALVLGALAVAGGLIAFGVVLWRMSHPKEDTSTSQNWIDRATNRDFSVLVLGLAIVGRLDWFLWAAAIGSHFFWMIAWVVHRRSRGKSRPSSSSEAPTPPEPDRA